MALFNHMGLLEIGIHHGAEGSGGGASQLFGLKVGDTVRIEFDNSAQMGSLLEMILRTVRDVSPRMRGRLPPIVRAAPGGHRRSTGLPVGATDQDPRPALLGHSQRLGRRNGPQRLPKQPVVRDRLAGHEGFVCRTPCCQEP